jgi:hypothetical protein
MEIREMRASVPSTVVDNEYSLFPQGTYEGEIATAELRTPKEGWQVLKLAVENVAPREGTGDPGREKFQSDITILNEGVNVLEVADFSDPDVPFQIKRAAGLLAGLGEALGVAERVNGVVHADLKQVAEALIAGEFKGNKIAFEVTHFQGKKAGSKARDQYNRFAPAS